MNLREVNLYSSSGSTVTVLVREEDGTYTGYPHLVYAPYTRSAGIRNYQEQLSACLPQPKTKSAPILLRGAPEGAGSSTVFALRDSSNGTPTGGWTDFNGDAIHVYKASLDYAFQAMTSYTVGSVRFGMLTGDFTGDGKPDVAVLTGADDLRGPGAVAVLAGAGDGTYGAAVTTAVAGSSGTAFCKGDFNANGKLDVAVAKPDGVAILLGRGDGTFSAGTPVNVLQAWSVTAADFNGDNRLDLAVVSFSNNVVILLGAGDGTFQTAATYPTVANPQYAAAGDFNKDGHPDLAVAGIGNVVSILLGKGDGTFGTTTDYVAGYDPRHLVITDINGDGNLDVVIGDGIPEALTPSVDNGRLSALLGNGDGTFLSAPSYRLSSYPQALAVADFNGDGIPDAVAGGLSGGATMLLGKADGTLAPVPTAIPNVGGAVVAADFNHDGKMDLAGTGTQDNGTVEIALGTGTGTFQTPVDLSLAGNVKSTAAADFNGDGRMDLAVAFAGYSVSDPTGVRIFLQQPGGTFQAQATDLNPGTGPTQVLAADVTGDGKPDLIVVNAGTFSSETDPGGVAVLAGRGDGTFANPAALAAGINPSSASLGDLNGDHLPDLAVTTNGPNFANNVALLLGAAGGGFRAATLVPTDFGPASVAMADFSGDGKQDLVVAHCCGDVITSYMLGNGDGTVQPEVSFAAGSDLKQILATDMNADGKPDLVVLNSGTSVGAVTVLLNNSPGPSAFTVVSDASFQAGPVAPESIVAAFGVKLATGTAANQAAELPLTLAGTTISLVDAAGAERAAPLFYASPTQVNFLIPKGTATGRAAVTIRAGDGTTQTGAVDIAAVAPGIFPLNQDPLAAAQILRVAGTAQTIEDLFRVNGGAGIEAAEIDFGADTDRLFLLLYCTGVRNVTSSSDVRVQVGSASLAALFAGAQSQFPGLDQVNVELPRSLKGAGTVNVSVTAQGVTSNVARLRFRRVRV